MPYNPTQKQILKNELAQLKLLAQQNVVIDRNKNWSKLLRSFEGSPKKFWSTAKKIRNKKSTIPAFEIDGTVIADNKDKADALANAFYSAHCLHTAPPNDFDNLAESEYTSLLSDNSTENAEPFDYADLLTIIGQSKNKKAPGADGVSNLILKHIPTDAVKLLTAILNRCCELGHWAEMFKTAIVVPILKAGKPPNHASSYRPISLLSSIAKVFDSAILGRIREFCFINNVLPTHQFRGSVARHRESLRHGLACRPDLQIEYIGFSCVYHQNHCFVCQQ